MLQTSHYDSFSLPFLVFELVMNVCVCVWLYFSELSIKGIGGMQNKKLFALSPMNRPRLPMLMLNVEMGMGMRMKVETRRESQTPILCPFTYIVESLPESFKEPEKGRKRE